MTATEPLLPQTLRAALDRYLEHGILPGGFLLACLENDLAAAVARADSFNAPKISNIISYFIAELPDDAWGTPEKVERWHINKTNLSAQGGNMSGEMMLLLGAIAILIVAVFVYINRENQEHGRLANGVDTYGAIAERIEKENKSIRETLNAQAMGQQSQTEFNDKLMQRMQYLELRMDANKSVHPVQFPKSLKVELSTPMPVKVLYAPAVKKGPPPLPVGKAQKSVQQKATSP